MSLSNVIKSGFLLAVFLMFGAACERSPVDRAVKNSPETKVSEYTQLPSGKRIKISSIGPVELKNGEKALILEYETETLIENKEELNAEASEIWGIFVADVERAGYQIGVLRARRYEGSGLVREGKGFGFVYRKQSDGGWKLNSE